MGKHTISDKARNALAERAKASGGGKFFTPKEIAEGFALEVPDRFAEARKRGLMSKVFDKPIGEPLPAKLGFFGKAAETVFGSTGMKALEFAEKGARIAGETAIIGAQTPGSMFGAVLSPFLQDPEHQQWGSSQRLQQGIAGFKEAQGRKPSLLEAADISAQVNPLPIGVRPAMQALADPLNLTLLAGPAVRGLRSLLGQAGKTTDLAQFAKPVISPAQAQIQEGVVASIRDVPKGTLDAGLSAPTAAARVGGITTDEVTELGRLKGHLANQEAALEDLLSDPEALRRGLKPRPYSVRYPGRTPGSEGYRPPTKLGYTEAERLKNITEAEEAVTVAEGGVTKATKAISDERAIAKQAGKKPDPDDIADLNEELIGDKSALSDARDGLKEAKQPTAYTAKEKAYIAAADKLDVEYPERLRTSIKRAQKEITDLEARQAADVPTTLARIGRTVPTLDDALEAGVKSAASEGNLPIPPRTPALASKLGATPNDPGGTFAEVLNAVPGRHPMTTLLARWEGARNVLGKEMAAWWEQGQSRLKTLNLGIRVRNKQVLSEVDGKALFRALHDREIDPPPHLQGVFDDLKAMVGREEADMLAFDPDFKRTLMAHPDYFPRGWQDTRYGGKKQLGARPDFLKPRNDATFSQMLDAGYQPKSWNPYDMMVLRRIEGVEYREAMQLMQAMKKAGLVVPERGAPAGWKVPNVGPAFTGKPFTTEGGQVLFTPRLAVPKKWAKRIESMYGKHPEFVVNGRNILLWPIRAATAAKRQVLLFSGFQHLDFAIRGGAVASSIAGIRGGATVRYPSLVGRLLQATVDPRRRRILSAKQISDAPIFPDSAISFRMVANEGWQIGGDPSVLRRDALSFLEDIKVTERPRLPKRIIQRIDGAMRFWESGLFDGVYPETQMFALERMIIPKLRRIHPDWNPQQIAGSAAEEVNKMFSSLGEWQTIFSSSPEFREFSRALIFSTNESESWLRAAVSTVKGPNKRLWLDYWVGYVTFLAAVGNGINLASTGQFMSAHQYIPITTNDPFAALSDEIPIIGGVGYNTEFLAPVLPWTGRNGAKLFLDIVGQADTPLRWILGPVSALSGRLNVWPNMVRNQIRSSSFFGEPIEGVRERTVQAVRDVAVPMGLGNLIQAGREVSPAVEAAIPEEEGRIGGSGFLVQSGGLNVRAEGTKRMLDRTAAESGLPNLTTGQPVQLWDELEPHQQDQLVEDTPELQKELELRQETAVRRDRPKAKGFDLLDKANDLRLQREQALVKDLQEDNIKSTNVMRKFRELYADIQALTAERRSTIDDVYQLFAETGKKPTDPNERALVEYYSVFAKARQASTRFDFDVMDEEMAAVETKWTEAQKAYVDRNTGRTEHPPLIQEYLRDREIIKRYLSAERDLIEERGLSDVYKEWRASTDKTNFLNAHIVLKAIIRRVEIKKMAMRKNDIDLERKLWKWGYISAAENPFLSSEIKVLRKQQGGEITNHLAIEPEPVGVAP